MEKADLMIVLGGKPKEEEKSSLKEDCSKEILSAIEKKDAKMLAEALSTFMECCEAEEEKEE